MDWNHELLASLIWLGKAFIAGLIGFAAVVAALVWFTTWGRQFLRITGRYFQPSRSKRPLVWLALIILMTLFTVRMTVLFSFWYNDFYSAMQKLDARAFWFALLVFATLATVHVARELLTNFLRQAFVIHWRIWLTAQMMELWLDNQAYYRTQHVEQTVDNPDQRIQQDVDSFVHNSLNLSMGLLDAVVSLFAFSIILWNLSGSLSVMGWDIPRAMVFAVYLYVIVATVFALKIGRPLIRLNYVSEQLNATFRYALIRLREYGESIAFYHGEAVERANLLARFGLIIANMWALVFRSLKFLGFNLVVSQAAVVFPFLVQAPRLLSKQITLGDVMQTAQSFGQVEGALSYLRSSYDQFAAYRAVVNRLASFLDAIAAATQLPRVQLEAVEQGLAVHALTVHTPTHAALVHDLNLALPRGASLLVRGCSGIGKTTLLRALAGLWPHAHGTVRRPLAPQTLFLPQKPYLPQGTLRLALYYPAVLQMDDRAAVVLRQCHLAHLVPRLDEEDDWTRILSLGELQRLAIGRALLSHPQVLFLDEASSAMDEGLEHAMYALLRQSLPHAVMVSVGHRSSLRSMHLQELELLGEGRWALCDLPTPSAANAPRFAAMRR